MIEKEFLLNKYIVERKSVSDIAKEYGCSQNKITYWLQKHNIQKRTISDAVYIKSNPLGDPFVFTCPKNSDDWFLYGLGLGLFWGEGNKMNKHSVRLGNTDPDLVHVFLLFLKKIYAIEEAKLRFGLQIFADTSPQVARAFWVKKLHVSPRQFQKLVVTKSVRQGTYTKKSKYGVLTIYFSNVKLRDTIMQAITELRNKYKPS